jgi:hypothetical protein
MVFKYSFEEPSVKNNVMIQFIYFTNEEMWQWYVAWFDMFIKEMW